MHHEKIFVKCDIGVEHWACAYVSVAPLQFYAVRGTVCAL